MSLQIGIVGLPNAGKSTLFNALTRAGAAVASYPFTTIEPNVGVVTVPDARLDDIARIVQPEKVIPTTIEFVDIAGLVKGAHQGEGLGNQFLGHIHNVDAVLMVLRCFEDENIAHVAAQLDPVADLETLNLELSLADLASVERRLEKARGAAKAEKEARAEVEFFERLQTHLGAGRMARDFSLHGDKEQEWFYEMHLLTAKPVMYLANVGEDDLPEGGALAARMKEVVDESAVVVLCAELEAGLAEWEPDEAEEYRATFGLSADGLSRLIHAGYKLLDLITFFTTTGGHEVRAWTLKRGTPAVKAAGKIHTDMERGFIRAEVVHYDDLAAAGDFHHAREQGKMRLEGKDYAVQDGDVIHFKFNV